MADHGHPKPRSLSELLRQQQDQEKSRPQHLPTLTLATHNILDGRNNRLESALYNLGKQEVDIAILTELRIPAEKPMHTKNCQGYNIFATYTTRPNQGGLVLATRTSSSWHIESTRRHGPNVLSCLLKSGHKTFPIIGCYLPPSHLDDLPDLVEALTRFPTQNPIVLGDLNVDLSLRSTETHPPASPRFHLH